METRLKTIDVDDQAAYMKNCLFLSLTVTLTVTVTVTVTVIVTVTLTLTVTRTLIRLYTRKTLSASEDCRLRVTLTVSVLVD